MSTKYPELYAFLGNSNKLPDYRECAIVGIGTNGTETITTHDTYTLGQFKDDSYKAHKHTGSFLGKATIAYGDDRYLSVPYTGQATGHFTESDTPSLVQEEVLPVVSVKVR